MPVCSSCGTANREGRKFCSACGNPLLVGCPSCGAAFEPGDAFCGECGAQLGAAAAAPPRPVAVASPTPMAERRLVSVLFADLVGFTTLSERRDPEEVRELLSRYFDTCRRLIERYGGTVEKFIGDAVMAVWGTPTATEDDAERAVRAALDLVAAVAALGDEVGAPELAARAGVLTGEAAVNLAAVGEGMVAGDLVNTAARIQSAAQPGTVFVGDSTRRASELTVVFEDAGQHELKGKEEAQQLYRALRVAAGRRGALKSSGLEAPFVGRDRELRLVKELFHASADEQTAHLVSVLGIAGIGKSRLTWEFYKYFDGLADTVYWHRGRCLAYGEGVTYWALADMIRMRARISEDDDEATARSKLEAMLSEHLVDPDERAYVEPKLAHLLGLGEEGASHERHDLFAAWRLFFERMAATYPTVLVFEDMQWADSSLLDFVEYLLEWSRTSALYVLTHARPELLERRPGWGSGHRNFTSLHLGALPEQAMVDLLDGFVPGLPGELGSQILARAEGVPLYAVETVRMLLDRGLLVQDGPVYRPTGEIPTLAVPETLHGLVASRLDGLPDHERRLLQDAAVLGKTFTRRGLAAVSGTAEAELDGVLAGLVRKEILGVQADPTSPEHGQYGFLQDLLRHVAYETLSKRERRARHIAAAEYLEQAFSNEDEIAEVVASHYVAAHAAMPEAEDATELRLRAQNALVRAGERAQSLGAPPEAMHYFQAAAELAVDDGDRAALHERAGWLARYIPDLNEAHRLLASALTLYESVGDVRAAARVSGRLALVESQLGRWDASIERAEAAFATLQAFEEIAELSILASRLATTYVFVGQMDTASGKADLAMELAERTGDPEALTRALACRALVVESTRPEEATALCRYQLEVAREHGLFDQEANSLFSLSDLSFQRDRYEHALSYLEEAVRIARHRGSRASEWSVLSETTYPLFMLGRWEDALERYREVPEDRLLDTLTLGVLSGVVEIHVRRGDVGEARRILSLYDPLRESDDLQNRSCYLAGAACVARAEGRLEDALRDGLEAARVSRESGLEASQALKQGLVEAIEAARALEDRGQAEQLVTSIEVVPPGLRSGYLDAQATRFRGLLDSDAERVGAAAARFRELHIPFWQAVAMLEHGELTRDEASLGDARELFAELEAAPWLDRLALAAEGERALAR